jgi:hypothetical protein
MRAFPRLGLVNLALVSLYFIPVWGHEALRALISPYGGFENAAQAAAASYFREVLNLGLSGLMRASEILAVVKLVIAAAFTAYLIELARALLRRREPNQETVDIALVFALVAIPFWLVPTLTLDDPAALRLQATQFLLLMSAAIVIVVERSLDPVTRSLTEAGLHDGQLPSPSTSLRTSPASWKAWLAAGMPQ